MEKKDLFFKCPTSIYMVSNAMEKAGKIIKGEGYQKAFLIYGSHSLVDSGKYDDLAKSLKESNIDFEEAHGVLPNPDIEFVTAILPKVRLYKPDLILAIGGGSVIDTAKSLAHAYYYDGNPLDFNLKKVMPTKALPIGVILTLSASGSEMSDSCVMSDRKAGIKQGFNAVTNRPTFSILDPELTSSVSEYQTCCGLVDIISHSFERYFSPSAKYELADYLALSVIKNCIEITPVLLKNPSDYEARRSMMLASTVSHNGWASFGKLFTFRCHFIEHQMSSKNPKLTHGLGLRFLLGNFMQRNIDIYSDKIIKLGQICLGVSSGNPQDSIDAFNSYLDSLPLPQNMEDVGFTKEEKEGYLKQLRIE